MRGMRGVVEILLVGTCYRNRDKCQPDGPPGSYADLTSTSQCFLPWPLFKPTALAKRFALK